jgi:hypothetical protein
MTAAPPWVARLSIASPDEDYEGYQEEADILRASGLRLPEGFSNRELTFLIRRAWEYRRAVARQPDPSPAPPTVENPSACENALTGLAGWCSEQEQAASQPAPAPDEGGTARLDGPEPPDRFWFRGKCYGGFTPRELELLRLLWEHTIEKHRWLVQTSQLAKLAYKRPGQTGAIRNTKKRLSQKLVAQSFPGELYEAGGFIILELAD